MRALLAVALCSWSAAAAPFEGTVVFEGAPVPDATVRFFVRSEESVLGCPPFRDGHVLGPCGCPAGMAALNARLLRGEGGAQALGTTHTDAQGNFSADLPPVVLIAVISTPDGSRWGKAEVRGPNQLFVLERTVPLQLSIPNAPKGTQVYRLDRQTRELARIDDFSAVRVPPGGLSMIAVAPGMVPVHAWARDAQSPLPLAGSNVDPHKTVITFKPPTALRARVTVEGKPIAGAEYVVDPGGCAIAGRTDDKGELSVDGSFGLSGTMIEIRSGERGVLRTFHGNGADVELKEAPRLEVLFVDAKGAPVPGVEAYLNTGDRDWPARTANAEGRWTLGVAPTTEVRLAVLPPYVLLEDAKFVPDARKPKKQLRVQRGVSVSGRVLDAAGHPMRGVKVTPYFGEGVAEKMSATAKEGLLWSRRAWTDMAGEFEIGGLLPGPYTLVANRGNAEGTSALVTAPGRVDIQKYGQYALTGVVVEEGGAPVSGASVVLSRPGSESGSWSAITTRLGQYRVEVPAPGSYEATLRRNKPGTAVQTRRVEITARKPATERFEVPRLIAIQGMVSDSLGRPLEGARVEVVPVDDLVVRLAELQRQPLRGVAVTQAMAKGELVTAFTGGDGTFSVLTGAESLIFVQREGFALQQSRAMPGSMVKVTLLLGGKKEGR
jgi:protocatechuate 3,4-dioxygenase beta subunit